jgi:adenosylhomocysteine nucleosidase
MTSASLPSPVRIGIVAALPSELKPLISGYRQQETARWTRSGSVYSGKLCLPDGTLATAWAAAAGMGAAAATRAFADVTAAAPKLDAIVSYGWAGAITCGVKPPEVYALSEVIDTRTGERFQTATPVGDVPLRLVTADHVARSDEKRLLAERYKAVLVDMEAATIGRLAASRGIPFYCCKGISDAYTDVLPDFNRFLDPAGQLRMPAFLAYALLHPQYWSALNRLRTQSDAAAKALAKQLPACFERTGLLF